VLAPIVRKVWRENLEVSWRGLGGRASAVVEEGCAQPLPAECLAWPALERRSDGDDVGGAASKVIATAYVRYDGNARVVPGRDVLTHPLPINIIGSDATDATAVSIVIATSYAAA
jgi:hypothetical protein